MAKVKKLNLGCGTDIREGYVNLDITNLNGVDVVYDLNKFPWPFENDEFEEVLALSNILGFVKDFVRSVEEIWRISKDGAMVFVESPLFPSPNCFGDPFTKKVFTYNSFVYFEPGNKFNYYTKARFKILDKRIIFSDNKYLSWLNPLPNLFPKFYIRFISNIIPSNGVRFVLKCVKNDYENKKNNKVQH